jgi:mRNA-degrading endonuclease RelE of RelBE toxin-antitoxin system
LKVAYRKLFLKDLKKLKKQPIYQSIHDIAFNALASSDSIQDLPNVKALTGEPNRYRVRVGDYRIGVELNGDTAELMRVLHRREFYRYFP